jgi:hypothetical protein
MGRRTWIAGLVLCAGVAAERTAAAQMPHSPVVYVHIMNRAGVPAETLGRAQDDAAHVFHLSGIALVWVDAESCLASCLTVRIVKDPVSIKSRNPHTLGVAPSTKEARGINVFIFYPRIRAYSADLGMQASQLLGHVMAHEMGHLLLPHGAHSVAGLMRPEWDRAQVRNAATGLLTFTSDQASLIRERLRASVSAIAAVQ